MTETALWVTPLLLLPGVGLLIVSTAARYGEAHAEVHHLLAEAGEQARLCADHLLRRSLRFRNALLGLYCSVGLLAAASLLGGLVPTPSGLSTSAVGGLCLLGVASLLFAALELTREALISLDVIRSHVGELQGKARSRRAQRGAS